MTDFEPYMEHQTGAIKDIFGEIKAKKKMKYVNLFIVNVAFHHALNNENIRFHILFCSVGCSVEFCGCSVEFCGCF
jgi:hypothetical protein